MGTFQNENNVDQMRRDRKLLKVIEYNREIKV